jgi:hypothetical protein
MQMETNCNHSRVKWVGEQRFTVKTSMTLPLRNFTRIDKYLSLLEADVYSESDMHQHYACHVLKHSPFPLLTLFEFNRVLKKDAMMYVEVPQAESIHTNNPNHYSVLGKMSWIRLFKKSYFRIIRDIRIKFNLINGKPDEYWGWWLTKFADLPLQD